MFRFIITVIFIRFAGCYAEFPVFANSPKEAEMEVRKNMLASGRDDTDFRIYSVWN